MNCIRATRFILVALFTMCVAPAAGAESKLPNVVVIYADDMGYGDLAVQNPESRIPTPNLDRLAAEGLRFTDGHSSAAVCTLSRYALLTGEYHWRHVRRNADFPRPPVIKSNQFTLAELMSRAGYRTACIGKWHLGWGWQSIQRSGPPISSDMADEFYSPRDFDWSQPIPGGPTDHGFAYYFGDDVPNRPPYTWLENDRVLTTPCMEFAEPECQPAEGVWETETGPAAPGWKFEDVMPRIAARTVEWIGEQSDLDRPIFLLFSLTAPHAPIVPADEYRGASQAGGYGDFVHQVDQSVGAVLAALEKAGRLDNTIVIFTSDNGPATYAYERSRAFGHRSAGEFRGIKGDLWEGGHRVPFLVRWPGKIAPGTVSQGLVSQIDLMATLASIVGVQLPAGAGKDSVDLTPHWTGESTQTRRETLVYNTLRDQFAIRHADWVYIDVPSGSASPAPAWFDALNRYDPNPHRAVLCNLRKDPGQRRNFIEDYPDRTDAMRRMLHETIKPAE